ncbi:hypothetical protein [Hymenobacter swuensis]|uniref:Uncharacterized protein n=1 Tax=Hymenobacter swuensis DY53 TaxID=1227739 RepID=W8F1P8_9BACT|nr:hypothetical protein [Hymenobacter swuensis]AHJ98843.1 hypothetical protein Hsw_3248 [Hymenobacter swuensis DY53]
MLWCAGSVAALAALLTWRERAATFIARSQRLVMVVLPCATVLLGSVLWVLLHVMLLWGQNAPAAVALR